MGIVQDTFDGRERRDALEQLCVAQFVLDRLWAAQTDASFEQALTRGYDQVADVVGVASAGVQRSAGTSVQALPAQFVETLLPFGQPGRAAPDARENSLTRATL